MTGKKKFEKVFKLRLQDRMDNRLMQFWKESRMLKDKSCIRFCYVLLILRNTEGNKESGFVL